MLRRRQFSEGYFPGSCSRTNRIVSSRPCTEALAPELDAQLGKLLQHRLLDAAWGWLTVAPLGERRLLVTVLELHHRCPERLVPLLVAGQYEDLHLRGSSAQSRRHQSEPLVVAVYERVVQNDRNWLVVF